MKTAAVKAAAVTAAKVAATFFPARNFIATNLAVVVVLESLFARQIRDGDVNVAVVALDSVERSDDGLYGCTARNDGGEAYVNGHLEVQFPPSFDAMPNVDVYYSWNDNPINLTCIAESIPNATIRWYFSSNRVEASRNKQLTVIGEGPKSILQVTPKDTTHYTSYTCHAQNLLGDAEYVMKLTEAYPPESIQQAIIIEEESTADMVTFRFVGPREISGLEVDAYLVQYRRYDQSWADARRRIWTKGTPYVLEDLQPRETYAFRFAARNPVGTGDWAADVTRQMPEEGPPFRPVIEGAPISDTDFTQTPYPDRYELRWQVPPANGRPIDSFEVSFHKVVRDKSTGMWTQDGPKHTKSRPYPGGSLVMSLNGLDADTFYQVELRAHNIIGFSHPGLTVFKTERSHNQPPPETEKVKSASDDSEASSTTVETAEETYGLVIGVVAVVLLILIVVDFILCRKQKGLMYKVSRMCHRDSYSAKHYTLEEGKGDKDPKLVLNDAEKVSSETAPMISEPVASRSSKAIPPFSSTAAKVAANVAAVEAAVDENYGITLEYLEATLLELMPC
ncbi:unnamed protein product [Notodromas monacha]|uniref:Uncharacterized protein n=1 Tax=Notodromas monacha TaxID=399045 RepID=A0A7R9BJF8_9CRUS|nr:unnamed protein product [Notodromas monacha]CAG0915863.1 unnamed protein product [Notodromas monacha]